MQILCKQHKTKQKIKAKQHKNDWSYMKILNYAHTQSEGLESENKQAAVCIGLALNSRVKERKTNKVGK